MRDFVGTHFRTLLRKAAIPPGVERHSRPRLKQQLSVALSSSSVRCSAVRDLCMEHLQSILGLCGRSSRASWRSAAKFDR